MAKDEMVAWHHQLNGHEFVQTLGDAEGQGSLACCRDFRLDVPGGPAVKTLHLRCRGRGFNPWWENSDPACCLRSHNEKAFSCLPYCFF